MWGMLIILYADKVTMCLQSTCVVTLKENPATNFYNFYSCVGLFLFTVWYGIQWLILLCHVKVKVVFFNVACTLKSESWQHQCGFTLLNKIEYHLRKWVLWGKYFCSTGHYLVILYPGAVSHDLSISEWFISLSTEVGWDMQLSW